MKLEEDFQKFADYYDILYQNKDYQKECDFLEEVFRKYSEREIVSVLDLGCGTGNHTLILTKRGYKVTGVDLSERMVEIARKKARERDLEINFKLGDVKKLDLGKEFDAVILMFNVLGFQVKEKDISLTIGTIAKHLKKGGLCIIDCWYGPGVLNLKPERREVILKIKNDEEIKKITKSVIDEKNQTADIHYELFKIPEDRKLIRQVYKIKYFFSEELDKLFRDKDLNILEICTFGKLGEKPTIKDWIIAVILEKL